MHSPKLQTAHKGARWYEYYAGYSQDFVSDVFDLELSDREGALVLDPWNGFRHDYVNGFQTWAPISRNRPESSACHHRSGSPTLFQRGTEPAGIGRRYSDRGRQNSNFR